MAYLFLMLSIVLETIGTVCIKVSDGFTKPWLVLGTCVSYMACFYFLSLSLKTIPLGIVYSTWAGLGLVLVNAISIICFKQHFDLMTIFGVTLILVGVVVLNFFFVSSLTIVMHLIWVVISLEVATFFCFPYWLSRPSIPL